MTDVVALPKAVETRSVDLQEVKGSINDLEFVEVDQEVEDPVEEFMLLGCKSPMKDRALIEAGMEGGRHGKILIWKTGRQEFRID